MWTTVNVKILAIGFAIHRATTVIIRLVRNCALGRMIQYAVTTVKTVRPQRTGCGAGACHRARQRRDPVAGHDDVDSQN
jgi:hypothetical protein